MILQGTSERIQLIRWVFYSLFAVYIGYLLHDLFIGDSNQTGRYLWTMFAIMLALFPFAFERLTSFYIPWELKVICVLSLLLHTMGEFHRWYYTLTHYDKITHIVSAMGVAYLVFLFIIVIQLYYGLNWGLNKVLFFILLMTIAFGLFWEWWEIFSDLYFGSKFFWNLQDGYGDWLANAIGALIVAWDSKRYLESRSYKDMANDFLIQDKNGQYKIKWEVLPELGNIGPSQSEFDESLMERPDGLMSIDSSK